MLEIKCENKKMVIRAKGSPVDLAIEIATAVSQFYGLYMKQDASEGKLFQASIFHAIGNPNSPVWTAPEAPQIGILINNERT